MSLTLVWIAINNDYSIWFLWFAAIAFKPFKVKVKNLLFAPKMIPLLEISSKLGFILHNLGKKWKILHFLSAKSEENRIWIDISWIMEKNTGKLNKCNYWALDPKWTLDNISLTTEHSLDILESLVLFSFTCLKMKFSRNLKKDEIKEANWVGSITYDSPCSWFILCFFSGGHDFMCVCLNFGLFFLINFDIMW